MTEKLAVDVKGAAELLSISARSVWSEIADGRLKSFKIGKRRLVRVAEIAAYVERRELLALRSAR